MPAPGPNYPSPSTVRRHGHQAKLEAMFGLIEVSMTKHSALLGDVINGVGKLVDVTKTKDDDKDELEKLRDQLKRDKEEKEETQSSNKPKKNDEGGDEKNMAHIISAFFAGGLNSMLMGGLPSVLGRVGTRLAGGMLAAAVAGPISDFVATAAGRSIGSVMDDEELGKTIADTIQPNIETGLILGMFNKKAGLIYAIVGSALDGLTAAIDKDSFNFFGTEIDLNSNGMKAGLTGVATMLMTGLGRKLFKFVGRKLITGLLGPLGLIATVGMIAWDVIQSFQQQWINELSDSAKIDLKDGLDQVRNERDQTMWEKTFGLDAATPTREGMKKIDALGRELNKKAGGRTDDSRYWDGRYQTAMVPEIDVIKLDENNQNNFMHGKQVVEDLIKDSDIDQVPLEFLRELIKQTNRFGVEDSGLEEMVRQMTEKKVDENMSYGEFSKMFKEFKPIVEVVPNVVIDEDVIKRINNNQISAMPDYSKVDGQEYIAAYDKISESILEANTGRQDNIHTTMLKLPKDTWKMNPVNRYDENALDRLKEDSMVYNYTPIIDSSNNPVVKQGDVITTTHVYNGKDPSHDLRFYPHLMGY